MATFILKHNTSGSSTSGELQYNTAAKTLVVGDGSSVVTMARMDNTNTGSFGITGDLFVSGNTNIVGNLTFGDNASIDTVTVVASLSSSLIPESTNAHDLGSTTKYWKNGYITSLTGSLSGSINGIDITPFSASVSQSIGNLNNTTANHTIRIVNLEQHSSSLNDFSSSTKQRLDAIEQSSQSLQNATASLYQHSASINNFTASITSSFNTFSSSYVIESASFNTRITANSQSAWGAFQSASAYSSSIYQTDATQSLNITIVSQSAWGAFQSASSYSASAALWNISQDNKLDAIHNYTASLKNAIEVSGSGVGSLTVIYGDLRVEGTQSIINSENLAVKDNLIYLNDSSSITNPDLGIVGNYNDGTYAHTGIYRESVSGKWRVFKGLTDEPSGSINSGHASFQLADFEANEVSASINGIGNVTAYSASVDSRLKTQEFSSSIFAITGSNIFTDNQFISGSGGEANLYMQNGAIVTNYLYNFDNNLLISASGNDITMSAEKIWLNGVDFIQFSTSVDSRLDTIESTNITQSNNIEIISASAWGSYTSASSYSQSLNNTINSVSQSISTSLSIVSASLNTFSSSYKNDSSSFDTRIDNLEIISSSYLSFTQSYYSNSASFDTRISASTLVFNDTTGQTGIDFTKIGTQVSAIASGLSTTSNVQFASITASNNISSSGTVYCDTLVATTLVGATLPVLEYETNGTLGNILIKGATSKSIQVVDTITFTGMTQNGLDQYSATGLYMTGSISASLGFSGSINGIGNVTLFSSSIDQRIKDATNEQFLGGFATTSSLQIVSASAWGAFQSASSYSGSAYTSISSSNYNNTTLSASVYNFSSSIDTRVDTLEGTTHTHSNKANLDTINQNLGTTSTGVQFASLGVGTAPDATYEFKVAGDIAASGDIVAFNSSDERLKNNIKPIENGLEKINKISGYEFDWNEDLQKARKGHDVGILAHEIEEILPEAVTRRENGYLAVDYEKIIPLLIQSVKELSAKVKELENK